MASDDNLLRDVRSFAEQVDSLEVIARFDVDFDIPLAHRQAIGILMLADAFAPVADAGRRDLAVRVGAHWCDMVRADVEYDLHDGLRLTNQSRADAEALASSMSDTDVDASIRYPVARWFDGAGKVHYRLAAYTPARIHFERAYGLAKDGDLWWCLADIRSNVIRATFEERRQADRPLIDELERQLDELSTAVEVGSVRARDHGVDLAQVDARGDSREREHQRGYSSLLHNWSVALDQYASELDNAGHHDQADSFRAQSLEASLRAQQISEALDDQYRIAQALTHQARLLPPDEAPKLFRRIRDELGWRRGHRIARQQLAKLTGGDEALVELRSLLQDVEASSEEAGQRAGMDLDFHRYTASTFAALAEEIASETDTSDRATLRDEANERRLAMARTLRSVIALPAYKRAYNSSVRPEYKARVEHELRARGVAAWEEIFALVEESSARELLDLMSQSSRPLLGPPASRPSEMVGERVVSEPEPAKRGVRRRMALRSIDQTEEQKALLAERQQEFENQFLRQPLQAAPRDPDIGLRVSMFTMNHRDTCIVRYFTYGSDVDGTGRYGALVIRGSRRRLVTSFKQNLIKRFIDELNTDEAPREHQCRLLWRLLVAPVWPHIVEGGEPSHLVIVPTDDLFDVPFHVASEDGLGTFPLGARVPLSFTVSATAFVTRGRHLLRRQEVEPDDDLAALIFRSDTQVSGAELVRTEWPDDHLLVAGDAPIGLDVPAAAASWQWLREVSERAPEFFVYAGHGSYDPAYDDLGPYVEMRDADGRADYLTSFDIALRLRLSRNRMTVIGACLAAQGAHTDGGDIAGFIRAFIAAGAGVLATPLWSVRDDAMVDAVAHLLRASREAAKRNDAFEPVAVLSEYYQEHVAKYRRRRAERMPLVLYL